MRYDDLKIISPTNKNMFFRLLEEVRQNTVTVQLYCSGLWQSLLLGLGVMLSQKQKEATPSYPIMSGSYAFSQAEEDKTLPLYSKHDPNK